jgi:hypothetical protein
MGYSGIRNAQGVAKRNMNKTAVKTSTFSLSEGKAEGKVQGNSGRCLLEKKKS